MCIIGYSDLLVGIGGDGMMIVPQEPYLTSGSLAEQVRLSQSKSFPTLSVFLTTLASEVF